MKEFVIRNLVFLGLVIVITFGVKLSLPYYWGNAAFKLKADYVDTVSDQYNTAFIGPSTIVCNIVPKEFDKYTNGRTTSFNLGIAGMFTLEGQYLLENYVKNNSNIKNYFFHAYEPKPILEPNFHSTRTKYFMDIKRTLYAIKFYKNDSTQLYRHIISFFENLLGVGEFKDIISYYNKRGMIKDYSKYEDGYHNLDYNLKIPAKAAAYKRTIDVSYAHRLNQMKLRPSLKPVEQPTDEELLLIDILDDIASLENKYDINIYFVHMPNEPFYKKMNRHKNLYLGDGAEFPEFFHEDYIVTRSHCNSKGAKLLSKRLALAYMENQRS